MDSRNFFYGLLIYGIWFHFLLKCRYYRWDKCISLTLVNVVETDTYITYLLMAPLFIIKKYYYLIKYSTSLTKNNNNPNLFKISW